MEEKEDDRTGREGGWMEYRREQTDRRVDKTHRKLTGIEKECEWVA